MTEHYNLVELYIIFIVILQKLRAIVVVNRPAMALCSRNLRVGSDERNH